MDERVCVIVNPAAGRGKGARMIPLLTAAFAAVGVTEIRQSSRAGEERDIARAALGDGCTTIVVVGGDGTSANVANAILHAESTARLGVMPAGTGNDFAKALGTDRADAHAMAKMCVESSDARVDVGRIENNYFLNCCGFGFDVAVLQELTRTQFLRGSSVYVWAALKQLFKYHGLKIGVDGARQELHMMLVIANSPNFGGTFRIAPRASLSDGMLDGIAIRDLSSARRVAVLGSAVNGRHERFAEVQTSQSRSYSVRFESAPWYETDGELHHAQSESLVIEACVRALRVITTS